MGETTKTNLPWEKKMTAITGNTFPVKDKLKALGGRWNPDKKVWMIPDDKVNEAMELVKNAPKISYSDSGTKRRPRRKCIVCGDYEEYDRRGYPIVKILKSGECVDCYEERKMGY